MRVSFMPGMLMRMDGLSTAWPHWVDGMARVLFPPACRFCRRQVVGQEPICADCARHIHVETRHTCRRCGRFLPPELAPGPCGRCLHRPPPQIETVSLYRYDGVVREAILAWKLSGDDGGLRWLLQVAEGRIREELGAGDLLIPVPMPLSRMRRSGQHHAADLCRMLAGIAGSTWDWRLLRRVGAQPRQSELSGMARRRNLGRAFRIDADHVDPGGLPARLWLVDDILTTGTTARRAARALAVLDRPVHVLTLARAGKTN